jgi:WD repeat and SOF domain-containing protein 1
MRNLKTPSMVYSDHVAAVLSVDYSPTGKEVVSGSYDKTIRLWDINESKSKNIYSTKRMQHVFAVQYSGDSKYICSGSDDANLRMWKAVPNQKLGVIDKREIEKLDYHTKLKEKFNQIEDIKKISKRQLIPKAVKVLQQERRIQSQSKYNKAKNIAHSKGKSYKKTHKVKDEKVTETFQ